MNIDFENNFTASLATVLFVALSSVTAIATFIALWISSHSMLLAIVFFALISPFMAIGVGIMISILSWSMAIVISGLRRLGFIRKPQS